jgi:predicted DNA-binding WGR domain protein
MKSTTLYFKGGGSDKVYRAAIEQCGGGYLVTFAYGRRGSAMTTGTKTPEPVTLAEATEIFSKLEREKRSKGYTNGPDSESYWGINGTKPTGILPQLLNPVTDMEADILIRDDSFLLQPKIDGRRCLLHKEGAQIRGINRRGLEVSIPEKLVRSAGALPGDWTMDGELVGDRLHAFDLLEHNGSFRGRPYRERLVALLNLLMSGQAPDILYLAAVSGTPTKQRMFEEAREQGAEGVVFKHIDAPYVPGRPGSGGTQLKFKFVESASVVVTAVNKRRSVAIGVYLDGELVPAGNVTIPSNQEIPGAGDVAEVRYLYAMPGSNALYQPVFLGMRDDIEPAECTIEQLKFRQEPVEVAA